MRNSNGGATGFIVDVVGEVTRYIGIVHDLSVERSAGKRKRDGNWTGLIGKLLSHVSKCVLMVHQLL